MGTNVSSLHYRDPACLNGGPSLGELAARHLTPAEFLFTRSHAAVPAIDVASWRLMIGGLVERPLTLSLAELTERFPIREVDSTLICAGLRRGEFMTLGPLPGELAWGAEPAGTVRWRGVALADVLTAVGVKPDARHVEFEGGDRVERHGEVFNFGGSIDIAKGSHGDVLLAIELNGEPLTPDHGFPVRAVVPGWIGARSVKWLARVNVLSEPSSNYFQTRAYRIERKPNDQHDVSHGVALDEVALNAVILTPEADTPLQPGPISVSGWAIGAGGRPLTSVEVSSNGGRTWQGASLASEGSQWTWRKWSTQVTLAAGSHELVVRATDVSGVPQPPHVVDGWNVKGYANNAWHRVRIVI